MKIGPAERFLITWMIVLTGAILIGLQLILFGLIILSVIIIGYGVELWSSEQRLQRKFAKIMVCWLPALLVILALIGVFNTKDAFLLKITHGNFTYAHWLFTAIYGFALLCTVSISGIIIKRINH